MITLSVEQNLETYVEIRKLLIVFCNIKDEILAIPFHYIYLGAIYNRDACWHQTLKCNKNENKKVMDDNMHP